MPGGDAPTEVEAQPQIGEAVLRLFLTAERRKSRPGAADAWAPVGGATFLSVDSLPSNRRLLLGPIYVKGVDLRLPPGRYRVRTWFRPYVEGRGFELGEPFGTCEHEIVLDAGSTRALTRVQFDVLGCDFQSRALPCPIFVERRRPVSRDFGWWMKLWRDEATRAYLEHDFPAVVTAACMDSASNTGVVHLATAAQASQQKDGLDPGALRGNPWKGESREAATGEDVCVFDLPGAQQADIVDDHESHVAFVDAAGNDDVRCRVLAGSHAEQ